MKTHLKCVLAAVLLFLMLAMLPSLRELMFFTEDFGDLLVLIVASLGVVLVFVVGLAFLTGFLKPTRYHGA